MWQQIKTYLFTHPLHAAVKAEDVAKVTELLDHTELVGNGVNVNATDYFGSTALHYAAQKNNLKLLKLLQERGADVNAQSPSATFRGALTWLMTLPARGVRLAGNIFIYYILATYGLHYAKAWGLADFFTGITSLAATLGITSPLLLAVLPLAAFIGMRELISRFNLGNYYFRFIAVALLADLLLPVSLQYMSELLWFPAVSYAAIRVGSLIGDFMSSYIQYFTRIVIALFDIINNKIADFCLKYTDSYGGTALHVAARLGNVSAACYLMGNGADINVLDLSNKNALEIAFDNKNYAIVYQLGVAGANIPDAYYVEIHKHMENYFTQEMRLMGALSKIAPALMDNMNNPEEMARFENEQPELVFFGKIYNANANVGMAIMSRLENLGDTPEQSCERLHRIFDR